MLALLSAGCQAIAGPQGWAGPAASDNLIIAPTDSDRLVALDLSADDEQLWRFPPRNDDDAPELLGLYGTPAISGGTVVVGDYNDTLYALDLKSGELKWSQETKGSLIGGPAVDGDTVYVGSSDGCLYAFALEDGDERWEPFCTGEKIWSSPQVSGGILYFGSMDKTLYAVDAERGEERWRFKADAPITSTPVIEGGRVYVGALNSKFYALDASSGELVWSFDSSDWFWNRATVGPSAVFVANLGGSVYALDRGTGKQVWEEPFKAKAGVRAATALVEGTLVVADESGGLYGIDAATGEERWSKEVDAGVMADLLAWQDTVYLTTKDGALLAVDPGDGSISTLVEAGAD